MLCSLNFLTAPLQETNASFHLKKCRAYTKMCDARAELVYGSYIFKGLNTSLPLSWFAKIIYRTVHHQNLYWKHNLQIQRFSSFTFNLSFSRQIYCTFEHFSWYVYDVFIRYDSCQIWFEMYQNYSYSFTVLLVLTTIKLAKYVLVQIRQLQIL